MQVPEGGGHHLLLWGVYWDYPSSFTLFTMRWKTIEMMSPLANYSGLSCAVRQLGQNQFLSMEVT